MTDDKSKLPLGTDNGDDGQDGQGDGTPTIDYEKKFKESTRQEQIRAAQLKAAEERIGKLVNVEAVTDAELKSEFKNWDYLPEETQELYRKQATTDKKLNKAMLMLDEVTRDKSIKSELEALYTDYPQLRNREDEFKEFIKRDRYKDAPLDLLASAFLQQTGGSKKIIHNKVEGLDNGRGGQTMRSAPPPSGKKELSPNARALAAKMGVSDEDIQKFLK